MRHPSTLDPVESEKSSSGPVSSRRALLRGLGLAGAGAALAAGCATTTAAPVETATAAPAAGPIKIPGTDPHEVALLSSNENPFGCSPMGAEAMMMAVGGVNRYANDPTVELARKIAKIEGVDPEQIVIANGSSPILQAFGMWMGEDQGELVTSVATYENVPQGSAANGAKVIEVPMAKGLKFDLDAMYAKIGSGTKAAYICNPNNPTGNIVDPVALKSFVESVPKSTLVFIDEAYIDLVDDYDANVMTGLLRDGHNVFIARTFSKIYGMAGQRVGYAMMSKELAQPFWGQVRQGGVNHIGIAGAMASLDDKSFYDEQKLKLARGRQMLISMAQELETSYALDSQANFIFMDTGMPSAEFQKKMMAKGVKVGRSWKGYETWSRICVGEDWEIDRCRTVIKDVMSA